MKTLEQNCKEALDATLDLVPKCNFEFDQENSNGEQKRYEISPSQCRDAVHNYFGSFDRFSKTFPEHIEGQKHLIAAFASTPIAFANAWNMKTEELHPQDVLALSAAGGHFQLNQIPNGDGSSGSTLYQSQFPRGLVKSFRTKFTKGFRHKTDSIYEEDALDEMGVFTYATPNNAAGMMEYRFVEQLSLTLEVPLVFLVTQWFKYKTPFERLNPWLYMTGVAQVKGMGRHPKDPIKLQLITKDVALKNIQQLTESFTSPGNYKIRPMLLEHERLGWSYTKIKTSPSKRKRLIEFARSQFYHCPGHVCNHISFRNLKNKVLELL